MEEELGEKQNRGAQPLFASVAETIAVAQEDHVEAISATREARRSHSCM